MNYKNQSGEKWAQFLGLELESYKNGWNDYEQYSSLLLSRDEFLNRASLSKFKAPFAKSRRDAAQFLSNLNNKNNKNNKFR